MAVHSGKTEKQLRKSKESVGKVRRTYFFFSLSRSVCVCVCVCMYIYEHKCV